MGNGGRIQGPRNVQIPSQPIAEEPKTTAKQSSSTGNTSSTVPRDPGAKQKIAEQQLVGNLKSAELMKKEADFLKDGRITEDEAKQIQGGDARYLKHMLEHDSMDPKARKVLENAIKDRVGVPKNSVLGMKIAEFSNTKKDPAIVAKEYGPPEGYKTRYEALTMARGANNDAAAIFQDDKGRWHAVQTNVPLGRDGNPTWSPESKANHLEFVSKPDLKKWGDARKVVDDLKAQGKTLDDYELKAAYRDMIAVGLGVPATEVKIIDKSEDADPSKINFNPNLPSYGRSGAAKLDGKPHTLQIGIGQLAFDQPFEMITTAFHESTHVRHHERGNELLKQWTDIKGKKPAFDDWVRDQYKNHKISVEEKATVISEFQGRTGPTEAISYVNGFMSTFAVDRKDDKMIASELNMAASKVPNDENLEKELIGRLKNFYNGLDENDRTRFEAAMAKAKNDNPGSWLTKFQY